MSELQVVEKQETKSGFYDKAVALGVIGVTSMVTAPAFAEGLDYTAFTSEITSAKTGIAGVIGAIMVVLAMLLGWSLFKRGAK